MYEKLFSLELKFAVKIVSGGAGGAGWMVIETVAAAEVAAPSFARYVNESGPE